MTNTNNGKDVGGDFGEILGEPSPPRRDATARVYAGHYFFCKIDSHVNTSIGSDLARRLIPTEKTTCLVRRSVRRTKWSVARERVHSEL